MWWGGRAPLVWLLALAIPNSDRVHEGFARVWRGGRAPLLWLLALAIPNSDRVLPCLALVWWGGRAPLLWLLVLAIPNSDRVFPCLALVWWGGRAPLVWLLVLAIPNSDRVHEGFALVWRGGRAPLVWLLALANSNSDRVFYVLDYPWSTLLLVTWLVSAEDAVTTLSSIHNFDNQLDTIGWEFDPVYHFRDKSLAPTLKLSAIKYCSLSALLVQAQQRSKTFPVFALLWDPKYLQQPNLNRHSEQPLHQEVDWYIEE